MTRQLRWQLLIGLGLACVGGGGAGTGGALLDDYAYPFAWWGVLLLVDAWNARRHSLENWFSDARQFVAITVPISVLVWLFFEVLNTRTAMAYRRTNRNVEKRAFRICVLCSR